MAVKDIARRMFRGQPVGMAGVNSLPMSFVSGEQGVAKVYFPFSVKITKIRSTVQVALGASDAGTITGANATGNSAGGVCTHPLSAAIGNEQATTPTTNNTVAAGSYYQLTSAKTTAGGKVLVTLEYITI